MTAITPWQRGAHITQTPKLRNTARAPRLWQTRRWRYPHRTTPLPLYCWLWFAVLVAYAAATTPCRHGACSYRLSLTHCTCSLPGPHHLHQREEREEEKRRERDSASKEEPYRFWVHAISTITPLRAMGSPDLYATEPTATIAPYLYLPLPTFLPAHLPAHWLTHVSTLPFAPLHYLLPSPMVGFTGVTGNLQP